MPGPAPQDRKHGRTPNAVGDWREYDDVPFNGAPPMPKPPSRRRGWHPMVEAWWQTTSTLPHAKDWRADDWQKVRELMYEKERYYTATTPKEQTTAQLTEIRRREDALGIGEQARRALKIRYKQPAEQGQTGTGAAGMRAAVEGKSPPGGDASVIPLKDRRAAIVGRGAGTQPADVDEQTA